MSNSIADIRKDYKMKALLEVDIAPDPITQFSTWWSEAIESGIDEVNAMTLATSTINGIPSARIVLLKGYSSEGFVFFTNYKSQKGNDLAENPKASLLFFWKELERQVRIDGNVRKVSLEESDVYFNSRPRESRIGAWASNQSQTINNRSELEETFSRLKQQFGDSDIKRPGQWGGYIVEPVRMEFWQGRSNRLHDRILYTRQSPPSWKIERLSP